jgi:hypothetical protein
MTLTVLLIIMTIVFGAIAVWSHFRLDMLTADVERLEEEITSHANRIWRAIEEIQNDD